MKREGVKKQNPKISGLSRVKNR